MIDPSVRPYLGVGFLRVQLRLFSQDGGPAERGPGCFCRGVQGTPGLWCTDTLCSLGDLATTPCRPREAVTTLLRCVPGKKEGGQEVGIPSFFPGPQCNGCRGRYLRVKGATRPARQVLFGIALLSRCCLTAEPSSSDKVLRRGSNGSSDGSLSDRLQ